MGIKNHVDDSLIITDSYKTTQNVRRYFKSKFGEKFKLARELMNWISNARGLTMGYASDELTKRKKSK
ncbi:hypothetical protein DLH97_24670 [Vibrio parahaemolyticus]|nr:hypothetical protein [Vibrio parahaemolyticus]EGR2875313.1 hypothetical protein [Vibrio parahaemolyticus]